MKKILSVLVLSLSAIFLVACGSSSSKSIEGNYKEFYEGGTSKTMHINSVDFLEISESTIKTWDGEYLIDKEKQVVDYGNGQVKSYTVDSKTGVITFDDKNYVKVGSDYYQQLLDEGAEE